MNEAADQLSHPLPTDVPIIDPNELLLGDGLVQEVMLGAYKKGGEVTLDLNTLSPIRSSREGFTLNGQPGDLMVSIYAGVHRFGLVDMAPDDPKNEIAAGTNHRIAIVALGGDDETGEGLKIETDANGKEKYLWLSEPDTAHKIGRHNSSRDFDEKFGLAGDKYMSRDHLRFIFNDEGQLKVTDVKSSSGTLLKVRPEAIDEVTETDSSQELNNDVLENIEQEVGETAVEEVVEEPRALIINNESDEISPKAELTMKDLRERWGLGEDKTPEEAVQMLSTELERINTMRAQLSSFDGIRSVAMNQLNQSIGNDRNLLRDSTRKSIEEFLQGGQYVYLQQLAEENNGLMPPQFRNLMSDITNTLRSLEDSFNSMNQRGANFIDMDAAPVAYQALSRLPSFSSTLARYERELDEARSQIRGYREATSETFDHAEKYRNEQVSQWAKRLEGEPSEQDIEATIQEIQSSIARENEMVDNPNSPHEWFGNRVRSNTQTQRKHVAITKRLTGDNPSAQRYVAEIMTDMMAGKFDVDKDEIVLNKTMVGGVEEGQHRVAALSMLYGKEWQKVAREKGFNITTRG